MAVYQNIVPVINKLKIFAVREDYIQQNNPPAPSEVLNISRLFPVVSGQFRSFKASTESCNYICFTEKLSEENALAKEKRILSETK